MISIPFDTMAMKLLGDIHIRELYSNILEERPVYMLENEEVCEIAKNILQKHCSLFEGTVIFLCKRHHQQAQTQKNLYTEKELKKELRQAEAEPTKSKQ